MTSLHSGLSEARLVSVIKFPNSEGVRPSPPELEKEMFTIYQMLRDAGRTYAKFRKTRNEIANLPLDVALDLDIYPGDADRIAREVVYGCAA